jgi:hypothetical protein
MAVFYLPYRIGFDDGWAGPGLGHYGLWGSNGILGQGSPRWRGAQGPPRGRDGEKERATKGTSQCSRGARGIIMKVFDAVVGNNIRHNDMGLRNVSVPLQQGETVGEIIQSINPYDTVTTNWPQELTRGSMHQISCVRFRNAGYQQYPHHVKGGRRWQGTVSPVRICWQLCWATFGYRISYYLTGTFIDNYYDPWSCCPSYPRGAFCKSCH